jgi:hypothetical protein
MQVKKQKSETGRSYNLSESMRNDNKENNQQTMKFDEHKVYTRAWECCTVIQNIATLVLVLRFPTQLATYNIYWDCILCVGAQCN